MASGKRAAARWGAFCVALALTACGGGGEDSTGAALPVGGATGLVPAAPAAGATLHAEAAQLRPLVEGATWRYAGTFTNGVEGTAPKNYVNVVTQSTASGGMAESASNAGDAGATTQTVSLKEGATHIPMVYDLDDDHSLPIDFTELRSPVRANDQYVSFDKRVDSLADVDDDGKNDIIDIVIYTRVIGEETLDLPRQANVQAVHVQFTTLLRVQRSKTGAYGDTVTATLDNWYAPGLGIVKSVSDTPGEGSKHEVTTEILDTWGGLSVPQPDAVHTAAH